MEEKFLIYDYTKPDENENRKKLIEQRHWAQKMNKTTGEKQGLHPNQAYGQTRKAGGTYKASVLDHLNQKPATPLSAGDILKLEELARTARSGNSKDKGNEWRPPSGLMGNSPPDGSPLDAVQARDDYILQSGGVPPPSRPPPLLSQYSNNSDGLNQRNNSTVTNNTTNTTTTTTNSTNTSTTTSNHISHKASQEYLDYQTRRSSDDSYRLASSPDNSEYPLIASAAALGVEYQHHHHNQSGSAPLNQQLQHINLHQNSNNNNSNNNNNNSNNPYPPSIISTTSSNTLNDPSRSMITYKTNSSSNTTVSAAPRPPPARISSIPRIHGNPLPPPTSLPPPIPSDLPPLPPIPKNYI